MDFPPPSGYRLFMRNHCLSLLAFAAAAWAQPQVLVTGLQAPNKIILTPQGNLLVSETSTAINAGRISLVTRNGVRRSLVEGLPSGTEVTLAGGSGPSAMLLRERTLYVTIGAGDSERRGSAPGTSMHNPAGVSSPIFASILEFRFAADIDSTAGVFRFTPAIQQALADGAEVDLESDLGAKSTVSLLCRFPISQPDPVMVYRFSNPWGLAMAPDNRGLYMTDASKNSLYRVELATGRWKRLANFPPLRNPGTVGPPVLDLVPTSVRNYGDYLLISYLSGFPFPAGNAGVRIVNPSNGESAPFMFGLTSVTDVLVRERPGARPQFFVLEFSANQSAAQPPPGRLLRFDTPEMQVAAPVLITPVSLALDEASRDLYILELRGQILRLRIE